MPKFRVKGKVVKDCQQGTSILATCDIVKEANSAEELRQKFYRDMKICYPMGPDYNVDYHCTVEAV